MNKLQQKACFPLVSIIIPNYNSSEMVKHTLNSCLNQSYPNVEIIVVDDFSTDESINLIKDFQKRYPNKVFLFKNTKKGGNCARIYGLKKSKGEYIQWLDSDDVIEKNKIKRQMETLIKTNADSVYSDFKIDTYQNKKVIISEEIKKSQYDDFLEQILMDDWSPLHNYLFKRKLVEQTINHNGWNEKTKVLQDREFVTIAAILGGKFIYEPGVYSIYNRWKRNSTSQSFKDKTRERIKQLIQLNLRFYELIDSFYKDSVKKQKYIQILDAEMWECLFYFPNQKLNRTLIFRKSMLKRFSVKKKLFFPILYFYRGFYKLLTR